VTVDWIHNREPFLTWLKDWEDRLPEMPLRQVVENAGGAENVGIVCVDVTVAFADRGRLASPRVAGIVKPIADLFKLAYSHGMTNFALPQDQHPVDSPEFEAYGPHSIAGSEEAETMPHLRNLPFADRFIVLPKQNINPAIDTEYPDWLEKHRNIRQFIVVGDVTDICVYQIAVHLQARANQFKMDYGVIVPANCVDTWDTPVEKAQELGIMPHDAELLHAVYLYHMALNAVQVVRRIV
jgi:nicotinamidase-related amidase